MMWYDGPGWGEAIAMGVSMVFWFGIFAFLLWGLFRWLSPRDLSTVTSSPSALELLRQRYARGDIDETTFLRMRQTLTASNLTDTPPAQEQ